MLKISNNPTLEGLSVLIPDIVYSTQTGINISMDIISPQTIEGDTDSKFPLVVFIQGSGFHFPDINMEIPQLSKISRAGYVVATVTHRNIDDGFPGPAFLQDVKTAIRFLRKNAEQYHIDPKRVYAFGTSSGGTTALLLGLTGDMEEFKTKEYEKESDKVDAVIDCFGPSDLTKLMREGNQETLLKLCGGVLDLDLLKKLSPINYVKKGVDYIPFLIAHGNKDPLVDFSQSEDMVKSLEEYGADVSLICVDGGEHEGNFWTEQIWNIFLQFLNKQAFSK